MKIVLDLQGCQSASRERGIGRYSLELSQAIARHAGKHEIFLLLNAQLSESLVSLQATFANLVPLNYICLFEVPSQVSSQTFLHKWRIRAAELIRERYIMSLKPDILYISSLFEGFVDDAVSSINSFDATTPTAVSLYDLIPLLKPQQYLDNERMREWYFRKIESLKRAKLLLAISEASRQEALNGFSISSQRIVNVSAAASAIFTVRHLTLDQKKQLMQRYNIRKPFVMYNGGIDSRKNVEGLMAAFSALPGTMRKDYQLVIVARLSKVDRVRFNELAAKLKITHDNIIFAGFVPDDDLVALYNSCALFVFPSFHEGFGLPVLEAMACGAPVIASNTTSIPEVIGCVEALFDPAKPQTITEKMVEVLTDEKFRKYLISKGLERVKSFSWESSAKKAIEAFESLHAIEQAKKTPSVSVSNHQPKPRLAYVSPLPPQKTGIAGYSAQLLPELAKFYDIQLIVDQVTVADPQISANFLVKDAAWFRKNIDSFDRVIYQFGNSPFHWYMLDLLKYCPGVVVFHDFYLSQLLNWQTSDIDFKKELYSSHGYPALMFEQLFGREAAVFNYPCNQPIFDLATGVIFHSQHALALAEKWYGRKTIEGNVQVIPLVREKPQLTSRNVARNLLDLAEDDFVVCSFGFLDASKLNDRIIEEWCSSILAKNSRYKLIFVGENQGGEYGASLLEKIAENTDYKDNIYITGYVESKQYCHYLAAADIAIQLRAHSRGETSAAILDCLAVGLPLVINAHGSSNEIPDEVVIKIEDDFHQGILAKILEELFDDKDRRDRLSIKAREFIEKKHHPAIVGNHYLEAIENFHRSHPLGKDQQLLAGLAAITTSEKPTDNDLCLAVSAINMNRDFSSQKQLFVDISNLFMNDLKTGIERCTRSILLQLFKNPPLGFRVEPVYSDGKNYYYARSFSFKILNLEAAILEDTSVDIYPGDIFFGLDWAPERIVQQKAWLRIQKLRGVEFFFYIHDILPVLKPELFVASLYPVFSSWLETITEIADGLVCGSKAVANDLQTWLNSNAKQRYAPLKINYSPHGADIAASLPTKGLIEHCDEILTHFKNHPTCLMVGTLEIRKGHAQTLAAFEQLWAAGHNINLVIVGKEGWMVESLISRLKNHPQNKKHLFWLPGISDEMLEKVYANATFLLAASYAEGFGLPLIEAAQHGLPILARDIPVFREVAGEYAAYFHADTAEILATAILQWLNTQQKGIAPQSSNMPYLNWQQSTQKLLEIILKDQHPYLIWQPINHTDFSHQLSLP